MLLLEPSQCPKCPNSFPELGVPKIPPWAGGAQIPSLGLGVSKYSPWSGDAQNPSLGLGVSKFPPWVGSAQNPSLGWGFSNALPGLGVPKCPPWAGGSQIPGTQGPQIPGAAPATWGNSGLSSIRVTPSPAGSLHLQQGHRASSCVPLIHIPAEAQTCVINPPLQPGSVLNPTVEQRRG